MTSNNPFLDTVSNFLSGAGQAFNSTIHNVEQGAQNFGQAAIHEAQQFPQQASNFMQNNPVGQAIGSQVGMGGFNFTGQSPTLPTIPEAHLSNPFFNTLANMGIGVPNDFIKGYNASQNFNRTAADTLSGKATPQHLIGNVAQQVTPLTYLMGGGEALDAGRSVLTNPSVRNIFLEGIHNIIPTAKAVGAYSGLQGLSDNQNGSLPNQFTEAGKQAAGSLPLSIPLAFAGPLGGYAVGKVNPMIQNAIHGVTLDEFGNKLKNLSPSVSELPIVKSAKSFFDMPAKVLQGVNVAIDQFNKGNIGDSFSNRTVQAVTDHYFPQFSTLPTPDQAHILENLINLRDKVMPQIVHPAIQPLVDSVSNDLMQVGKINFGAKLENPNFAQPTKAEQLGIKDFEDNVLHGKDNSVEERLNNIPSTPLRTSTGSYTNVRELDNPLINGQPYKPHEKPILSDTPHLEDLTKKNTNFFSSVKGFFNPSEKRSPFVQSAIEEYTSKKQQIDQRANILAQEVKRGVSTKAGPEEGDNIYNYGENKAFRQALEHPQELDQLASKVKNPQAFKQAVGKYQEYTDWIFNELKNVGSTVNYFKDYYTHILDPDQKEALATYLDNIQKNERGFYSKSRIFRNVDELEKAGFRLKNPRVIDDINQLAESYQRVIGGGQLYKMLRRSYPAHIGKASEFGGIPFGYKQTNIPGLGDTVVSDSLHNQIKNLEPNNQLADNAALKGYDWFNTAQKNAKLQGLFHALKESLIYAGNQLGNFRNPLKVFQGLYYGTNPSAMLRYKEARLADGTIDQLSKIGVTLGKMNDYGTHNTEIKAVPGNVLDSIFGSMHRFTFDRLINFYKLETGRDVLSKIDISTPEGLAKGKKIGTQINNLFGGLNYDNMGRSRTTQFILRNMALAPDFNEGKVRNVLSAVTDRGPGGGFARRALIGTALTTMILTEIGRSVSGNPDYNDLKSLWDNTVVNPNIPLPFTNAKGYKQTYEIPGTNITDLLRIGSNPDRFFTNRLASNPSLLYSLIRNKDYRGNDIVDNSSSLPAGAQQGLYVGKQAVPSFINDAIDALSGKSNPAVPFLTLAGGRVVNDPNDPNYQSAINYVNTKTANDAKLSPQQLQTAAYFNTSVANGGPDGKTKAQMLFNPGNEWLLNYARNIKLASNPNDSLWRRSPDEIKAYLAYEQVADPKVRAQVELQYPWINQVRRDQSGQAIAQIQQSNDQKTQQFSNVQNSPLYKLQSMLGIPTQQAPNLTPVTPQNPASPKDNLTQDQLKIVDSYTAAPQGSPQRKQILAANPWLKNYWTAETNYYNQYPVTDNSALGKYLTGIGINPIAQQQSFGRKVSFKKLAKNKLKKFKVANATKVKFAGFKPSKKQKQTSASMNLADYIKPNIHSKFKVKNATIA